MIADLGSAAVLGFVLGPVVGLICTAIDFSWVSPYSACGWLQAIFTIVMLIASLFFFTEIPRKERVNYMGEDERAVVVREENETEEQFQQRRAALEKEEDDADEINE